MKTEVLGVKIDTLSKAQVLAALEQRIAAGQQTFIVTPYSESIVAAQTNEVLKKVLNSADIALPDGIGILWAAKFLSLHPKPSGFFQTIWQLKYSLAAIVFAPRFIRSPIPEKISGSEFVWDLALLAVKKKLSIFLLGGYGNTAQRAAQELRQKFPELRVAGTYSGSPEERGLVEKINSTGAEILLAAFGPKRQELWIAENRSGLQVKVLIGLGGTFDYLAGNRPYRPKIWAITGLEWLWRLLTQPWRAGRIFRGIFGLVYYAFLEKRR